MSPKPTRQLFALLAAGLVAGCGDDSEAPVTCDAPPEPGPVMFVDRAEELGVTFTHHMKTDLCELTDTVGGPGVCAFDFDDDGDVDVFLPDREGHPSALYRNDGEAGFVDVAEQAGVSQPGNAIGCAAFDYDGDDDMDLFVTTIGTDRLYRNDGGAFTDVTDTAGLGAEDGFSSSATAGDVDGDGDLDLFVARVVDLSTCPDECYLFPINCEAVTSILWINDGGVFRDESASRGIIDAEPSLAALFFDQDNDGDLDLYVGNDMGVAFLDRLYVNDGTGHFVDEASDRGYAAAGTDTMGVDVGDFDGDGLLEMVTTDFRDRPTRLYNCDDPALPCSFEALPAESSDYVRWGIALEDIDGDRDLDIFQTGGDVYDPDLLGSPNQVFINEQTIFVPYAPPAGDALASPAIHRGAAFADLDGDRDIDVVVAVNGGRPRFLYNTAARGHQFMVDAGRRAVGARVTATIDGERLTEQVLLGGSYLSTSEPLVHFGMGAACEADVTVEYLDGTVLTGTAHPGELLVIR